MCTISRVDMESRLTSEEKTHLTFQHYTATHYTCLVNVWKIIFFHPFTKNGCFQSFKNVFSWCCFSPFISPTSHLTFGHLFLLWDRKHRHTSQTPISYSSHKITQYPRDQKSWSEKHSKRHTQGFVKSHTSLPTTTVFFPVKIRILVGKVLLDYLISPCGRPR